MKTPDEIKKGLECCSDLTTDCKDNCPYFMDEGCIKQCKDDAISYTTQLELFVSQVSKALCGKENATICEVLDAASQLKSRLVQVERERDAAVNELPHNCWNCIYHRDTPIEEIDTGGLTIHRYCDADYCYPEEENSSWKWRGVCPENTKEESM